MTDRLPLAQHTKASLDALYERAERAEQEASDYAEADSADAAAGSYALRAEGVEAQLVLVRRLHRPVGVVAAAEFGEAPDCAACKRSWPCQTYTAVAEPEPEQSARTTPDNPATSSNEADDLTGVWTPDPAIGCLAITAEPPVPRDPCPYCESSSERVPRHLMAGHVAAVHPEVRTGGPEIPVAEAEPAPASHREQMQAAIGSEVYEFRERSMWWPETGGVTQEIARLATRGAMEVRDAEVEQLRTALAAITAEAARRGVISIDGIRNITKERQR